MGTVFLVAGFASALQSIWYYACKNNDMYFYALWAIILILIAIAVK